MSESATLPNAQELAGSWNELVGRIRKKWGQLTEDDLEQAKGNVDLLIGRIQQKTGRSRAEIETFISEAYGSTMGTLQKVRDKAAEYTSRAGEVLQQQYENVSSKLGDGYESAQEMVRSRPAESVGIAFAAGMVFGMLITLALRSK